MFTIISRLKHSREFTAKVVRKWLERIGVRTLFIEPGSPWENGYNESFNGKLRDEVLNSEVFYNLKEAKVVIEKWRQEYNTVRPHSSLDYRPPAPEAIMPLHFDPFWLSFSQENIAQILTKRWHKKWGQVTLKEFLLLKGATISSGYRVYHE